MVSVIDIGSNTIRMKVYQVGCDGEIMPVFQNKDMTGLASYVSAKNTLTDEGIAKAAAVLRQNGDILKSLGLGAPSVFATASLRNIANTQQAVQKLESMTNMHIDVLSGKKEAALDYIGATWGQHYGSGVVIDIGGGSTELTFFKDDAIVQAESLPVGSLNMYTSKVEWLLPTADESDRIAKCTLRELRAAGCAKQKSATVCGVGGTIRACAKLAQTTFRLQGEGNTLPAPMVTELLRRFSQPSHESLRRLLRTVPERIHTILPGLIILNTLMDTLENQVLTISPYGVREGYLVTEVLHLREVSEHVLQ